MDSGAPLAFLSPRIIAAIVTPPAARLDINRAVADLRRNLDPEQLERANRRVRLRFFRKVKIHG